MRQSFVAGRDTPRDYPERCLARVAELEPKVRAFVRARPEGAWRAADAASARWRAGRPLSVVDGPPVAIRDCFDVAGFPTECNSGLFANNIPAVHAMHVDALRRGGALIAGKTVIRELGLPLLAVGGVPFGIQIMGLEGEDEDLAVAHTLLGAFASRSIETVLNTIAPEFVGHFT